MTTATLQAFLFVKFVGPLPANEKRPPRGGLVGERVAKWGPSLLPVDQDELAALGFPEPGIRALGFDLSDHRRVQRSPRRLAPR